MALWRVDVCGVSHRFVEAATRSEAEDAVRQALVDAMDIRASDAGARLTRAYDGAGPVQRKGLLMRLDGVTNPKERQSSKSAHRRLEREVARQQAEREWVAGHLGSAPPVSPEQIDHLVRVLAMRRIEDAHMKLPEWERQSPVHGETP